MSYPFSVTRGALGIAEKLDRAWEDHVAPAVAKLLEERAGPGATVLVVSELIREARATVERLERARGPGSETQLLELAARLAAIALVLVMGRTGTLEQQARGGRR